MGCAMMIGVAQVMGMKPTFRSFFSGAAAWREGVDGRAEREELGDRGESRGGADGTQEGAAGVVLRDERPHHG